LTLTFAAHAGQKFNPFTGKLDYCVTIEEEDGSPSNTSCQGVEVPNGSLVDDGDGRFSLFSASVTFTGDLDLEDATPHLRWTDTTTGDDDWEASANADVWRLTWTDGTTSEDFLQLVPPSDYFLPRLMNCSTMGTDGVGKLICGTGGSSAGDIESVTAGAGLTGGGASGAVTLTVGAGTGITVNADDVAVTVDGIGPAQIDETASYTWSGTNTFQASLNVQASGGTLYGIHADATTFYARSPAYLYWQGTDAGVLNLGTTGFALTRLNVITSTTGDAAVQLPATSIGAGEIDKAQAYVWTGDHDFGGGGIEIENNTVVPSSCTVGQLFMDTDATSGQRLYGCEAGVFVLQGDGGGGGGTPGGSGSEIQYRGGASTFSAVTSSSVSGGAITLADQLTISMSDANLRLADTDTGGSTMELRSESDRFFVTNTASGNTLMEFDHNDNIIRMRGWPDKVYSILASAMLPLEAADSIPPLSKKTGTNIDVFTCSFDASTDEGRQVVLHLPEKADPTGTVTFKIKWFAASAAGGNVVWDVRTAQWQAGQGWDTNLTINSVTSASNPTLNVVVESTITATMASLAWNGGTTAVVMLYRDANAGGDTLGTDAEVLELSVAVPMLGY